MINQEQADSLCKTLVQELPGGEIDASAQKMLMLAIKVIKGAVKNDDAETNLDVLVEAG